MNRSISVPIVGTSHSCLPNASSASDPLGRGADDAALSASDPLGRSADYATGSSEPLVRGSAYEA